MSFADSILGRLLRRVAHAVCAHRKGVFYSELILFVICVLLAAHGLKLDMNRDHLIGANSKYHQSYLRLRTEFPGPDDLVVVVESGSSERNRQFIERLGAKIQRETNFFNDLFYRADLTTLGPKSLLLVPETDLVALRQTLRENLPMIREFAQATNLDSFFGLINAQFLAAGGSQNVDSTNLIRALPLLQSIVTQARESLFEPGAPPPPGIGSLLGGAEATQQSYVTFDHGRIYLLTARAKSDALNPEAIERLRALMEQTRFEEPGIDAGLTGGPVLDYDETLQAKHDSTVASIVSLALCSLIFISAYGQVGRPLKAAFCLIIGLGYTMGFTTLAIGHLNILTVTFAPMLVGLAIDFGVHFISRYEEETRSGETGEGATHKAMVFTGQGIVTGALTTAAAFLAMALTNFKGIQEMGVISGGGLMLCLVPMLTVLPVMLMRGRQNLIDRQHGRGSRRRARIERLWLQRPWLVLLATLVLCAGAALEFRRVTFDYDLLHLQSPSLPAVVYEEKLVHSASQSALFGTVMADDARQGVAYQRKLEQLPAVASVESMANYFTGDQERKLQLARAIKDEVRDLHFASLDSRPVRIESLSATLWYLTGFLGLAADQARKEDPALAQQLSSLRDSIIRFHKALFSGEPQVPDRLYEFQRVLFESLRQTFEAIKNQDTSGPLRPQDLPAALRDRFIGVTGKFLLQVYPKQDLWQHEYQREFLQQLESVVPADRVDGTPLEIYEYTTLLKDSYQQAAWYALGAIVVMVFLHFRSLTCVVVSLLPVAIGGALLLGFMGLTGTPFNPANVMTLPLIIGIGVTNGIQILNRLAEERTPEIFAKSTGKAVLVSGVMAATGFASLILAKHHGIRSLGVVMAVGITCCLVASLTFVPALLAILMRRGWRMEATRPRPAEEITRDDPGSSQSFPSRS